MVLLQNHAMFRAASGLGRRVPYPGNHQKRAQEGDKEIGGHRASCAVRHRQETGHAINGAVRLTASAGPLRGKASLNVMSTVCEHFTSLEEVLCMRWGTHRLGNLPRLHKINMDGNTAKIRGLLPLRI